MPIMDLHRLSQQEKLILIEEIWDSITHGQEEPESPDWHKEVLRKRLEMLDEGKEALLSINDVRHHFKA